jgi:hypothetical protein
VRFEEFDRIASWVVEQDLPTTVADHNIIAEVRPCSAQCLYFGSEVGDLQLDTVPATRLRFTALRHGLGRSARACWYVQHQAQVATREACEARGGVKHHPQTQQLGVERDCCVNIIDAAIAVAPKPFRRIFSILRETGMRVGEVLALSLNETVLCIVPALGVQWTLERMLSHSRNYRASHDHQHHRSQPRRH